MNSRLFFQCCSELLKYGRWRLCMGKHNDIRLLQSFFIASAGDLPPVCPIVAVAIDVCGLNFYKHQTDFWTPVNRLELSKDFAVMVQAASLSDIAFDPNVKSVRAELVASLEIRKRYKVTSVEGAE